MNLIDINDLFGSNNQYRDSVFCDFFSDPVRLLSLCNAVLDTNYDDPNELQITTLDGIFFSAQKNDISCKIRNDFLVFVEHQSTINENMPLRFFSYAAEVFNNLIKNKRDLYKKTMIKFAFPKFFVLYNGNEKEPLKRIMKLSDALGGDSSSLELIVTSYNINYNINQPLLNKCKYLNEYSTLVDKIKNGLAEGLNLGESMTKAINFCINNNIMKNYLQEKGKEVFSMFRMEWNIDEAMAAWKEEALEQGMAQGIEQGMAQGIEQGMAQGMNQGIEKGMTQGIEKGRIEGEIKNSEKIAYKMIRKGMAFETIQELTELPLKRIQEMADSLEN